MICHGKAGVKGSDVLWLQRIPQYLWMDTNAFPQSAHKKRGCEEMNPHFFTAPFYFTLVWFALIWFKVQGSEFRVEVAALPPFLEEGILVSQPSPLGNAIKLRKSLAAQRLASPFGGSAEGNRGMPAV